MEKISLIFLVLLSLILGSAYVSAQGIEIGGDLTFSSFTNWNDNEFSSVLKTIKGEYNYAKNIAVFGSFQFGKTEHDIYVPYNLTKFKLGGQYKFPINSLELAARAGFTSYNVERDSSEFYIKTSAFFFGGQLETQVSPGFILYGLLDFSPFAKTTFSNGEKLDSGYAALELGAEYNLGQFQLVGGFRSEAVALQEYTDKWSDGGLFLGAKAMF